MKMSDMEFNPIDSGSAYRDEDFRRRVGFSKPTWYAARRKGLPVRVIGGKVFVLGSEFLEWLKTQPEEK